MEKRKRNKLSNKYSKSHKITHGGCWIEWITGFIWYIDFDFFEKSEIYTTGHGSFLTTLGSGFSIASSNELGL